MRVQSCRSKVQGSECRIEGSGLGDEGAEVFRVINSGSDVRFGGAESRFQVSR